MLKLNKKRLIMMAWAFSLSNGVAQTFTPTGDWEWDKRNWLASRAPTILVNDLPPKTIMSGVLWPTIVQLRGLLLGFGGQSAACGSNVAAPVCITAGSEPGHAFADVSHPTGFKLDLSIPSRLTKDPFLDPLSKYIQEIAPISGLRTDAYPTTFGADKCNTAASTVQPVAATQNTTADTNLAVVFALEYPLLNSPAGGVPPSFWNRGCTHWDVKSSYGSLSLSQLDQTGITLEVGQTETLSPIAHDRSGTPIDGIESWMFFYDSPDDPTGQFLTEDLFGRITGINVGSATLMVSGGQRDDTTDCDGSFCQMIPVQVVAQQPPPGGPLCPVNGPPPSSGCWKWDPNASGSMAGWVFYPGAAGTGGANPPGTAPSPGQCPGNSSSNATGQGCWVWFPFQGPARGGAWIFFPPSKINPPTSTSPPIIPGQSLDPNEISGPAGSGSAMFISGASPSHYGIFFENEPTAGAAANQIIVTTRIDPSRFDLNTLTLGPIMFPGYSGVAPPSLPLKATGPFSEQVSLASTNLFVNATASLNATTGVLTWVLQAIDPNTGQPPSDPSLGVLPPGTSGAVSFTASLLPTLIDGTIISEQGTVVFDTNPAMSTLVWSNTLDSLEPSSHVNVLASPQGTQSFTVSWAGTDSGSGVQSYTIYVSDSGAPYTPWLTQTKNALATFVGSVGRTYSFYSIATDNVGNVEPAKTSADTTTTIVLDSTPPSIVPAISGTLGKNGWYTSNVNIAWSVTDPESGIASSTGCTSTAVFSSTVGVTLTCSATNNVGMTSTSSVTLKVDLAPPVLSLPLPINAAASTSTGTVVSYSATAIDNLDSNPAVSCTPASGSTFQIGSTTVTCLAIDTAGNQSAGTFTITVSPPTTGSADLALINLTSPIVKSGKQLTYLIAAANLGPGAARSVVISDSLPAGTTFVSAVYAVESCTALGGIPSCPAPPSKARCASAGNQVTCSIGDLPAFTAKQPAGVGVLITVQVSAPVGTKLVDTARISSMTTDPRAGNNAFTAVSTVTR